MKICYFGQLDISKPSGIVKKFIRQAIYWKEKGNEVNAFILSPSSHACDEVMNSDIELFLYKKKSWLSLIKQSLQACREILRSKPDLVYLRLSKFLPGMRYLSKNSKVVVEINTLLDNEHLKKSHKLVSLYSRITLKILLRNCSGAVFLTPEISREYHWIKKPNLILGDGIELDHIQLPFSNKKIIRKQTKPSLVFMTSNNMIWQGLDKVLFLAQAFPMWDFIIIGLTPEGVGVAAKNHPNVKCYGFLEKESYCTILLSCDVAIGTLALHRIKMKESTPLKVREYLSFGLPIIIGYQDTDFVEDYDFILKLPNTETNVSSNLEKIKRFVEFWEGKKVDKVKIRHIDTKQKEAKRLQFLQSIVKPGYFSSDNSA